MRFAKYHGLGNDYIVLDPAEAHGGLTEREIRLVCHRHFGVGSDGILLGPLPSEQCDFGVRIFNPDGSEAEKSGNGLRIFARHLWELHSVREEPFTIETAGGPVEAQVTGDGRAVTVQMGRVSFHSEEIPVEGPPREVINEQMDVEGRMVTFCAATVGNPHCVIPTEQVSAEEARELGPHIETDARFPNRTNVQFMEVMDRANVRIEIWERGAGYTLASGSSASASAAVAHRLGLCDEDVTVHMPGGRLRIRIGTDYAITMSGPVVKVAEGETAEEMFEQQL
ncbi:MAG: diaminopimelate epimerase [Candidatus Brocadiia bacterium]